jgi:uncharacterized protein YndB with AHSA1/START domain
MRETSGYHLEQERLLDAPPDRVFRMLTEPAELARWWGPRGFTMPAVDLDLRVGGGYRFTMQPPDGEAFHLSGEYLAVDPPRRLSFTFRWDEPDPDDVETVAVLLLETAAGGTRVRLSQGAFSTSERLALHRDGWSDSFDRLAEVLQAAAASR